MIPASAVPFEWSRDDEIDVIMQPASDIGVVPSEATASILTMKTLLLSLMTLYDVGIRADSSEIHSCE